MKKINIVIYGATGSIGDSALSVIRDNKEKFMLEGITCNKRIKKLNKIANEFCVNKIGYNEKLIKIKPKLNGDYTYYPDTSDFENLVSKKTDVIIFAISGTQVLDLIIKLIQKGKKIGLANKECIVSFGNNLYDLAKKHSSEIIPLDSEHNSIFHLLNLNLGKLRSITITASGGPFLNFKNSDLKHVTPKQALKHPIWKMGKKISVDSATMMNKALEIIEAKYLFNLKDNQLNALIHPQAIIHGMINYDNGVSTALMYEPDMKVPVSSLFFGFNKFTKKDKYLDLAKLQNLNFIPIDEKKFPAMKLLYEILKMGGLAPHSFSYLNGILVDYFLKGIIKFTDIVDFNAANIELIFKKNKNIMKPSIEDIKNLNIWIDKNIYIGS